MKLKPIIKFYTVAKGKKTGIFLNFDKYQEQVKGYNGSISEIFYSENEALNYLHSHCSDACHDLSDLFSQDDFTSDLSNVAEQDQQDLTGFGDCHHDHKTSFSSFSASKGSSRKRIFDQVIDDNNEENGEVSVLPEQHKKLSTTSPNKYRKYEHVVDNSIAEIVVFCDGSCVGNGKLGAKGGVGVYFGLNDPRNVSTGFPGKQTNNRAELYAILAALDSTSSLLSLNRDFQYQPLHIKTDSKYCINCLTEWWKNWERNGWKTSDKKQVENKELIQKIIEEIRARPLGFVKFTYVEGHSGIFENEQADRLAKQFAKTGKVLGNIKLDLLL